MLYHIYSITFNNIECLKYPFIRFNPWLFAHSLDTFRLSSVYGAVRRIVNLPLSISKAIHSGS